MGNKSKKSESTGIYQQQYPHKCQGDALTVTQAITGTEDTCKATAIKTSYSYGQKKNPYKHRTGKHIDKATEEPSYTLPVKHTPYTAVGQKNTEHP